MVGDDRDLTCTGTARKSERSSRSSADMDFPALPAAAPHEEGSPGVLSTFWVPFGPPLLAPQSSSFGAWSPRRLSARRRLPAKELLRSRDPRGGDPLPPEGCWRGASLRGCRLVSRSEQRLEARVSPGPSGVAGPGWR